MASRLFRAMAVASVLALPGATARADDAEVARLRADVARLQSEMRELRQLILQTVQNDQQHFEMLLKLVQSGGTASAPMPPSSPSEVASAPLAPSLPETATINGKVKVEGGELGDAFVYVEGLRPVTVKNREFEIRQKDKRFVPSAAVVQIGTRITFPNYDTVIHNVFSSTPGNAFDLGTVKAGDKTQPVVPLKPGAIEIYCNIHAKMRADLLVVANQHWAKVQPDGSFSIAGVPVGQRRVVLWGPRLGPAAARVDLTGRGAMVNLTATPAAGKPHLNKVGQAYGSYAD
jgi:plastocyanin